MSKLKRCLKSWYCLEIAGFVFLGFCAVILSVILYWSFYPYNPLEIKNVTVHDKVLQRGGELKYTMEFCKNTDKEALIEKEWVDGVVFKVPAFVHKSDKGCDTVTPVMEVPMVLPDGWYDLEMLYIYQVNPIRKVIVKEVIEDLYVSGDTCKK